MVECKICQKEVKPTEANLTDGAGDTYHSDCFVCSKCDDILAGKQYYTINDEKICKDCYTNKVAEKCVICGKPCIDSVTTYNNEKYHRECFTCAKCNKPIDVTSLIGKNKDNKPIHAISCDNPDARLKCSRCNNEIGAGVYHKINGKDVCEECATK